MNYALVIGIDHYPQRPLSGAVNDANDFANWLKEKNLISNPDKNLKLLTSKTDNDLALSHHIDLALVDIIKDASKYETESNRLYFYFSGHGVGASYSNTGLCLRFWQKDLPHYNISCSAYNDAIVNQALFNEIIIFLDCCRDCDGQADPKTPYMDQTFIGSRKTNLLALFSTGYGKTSSEINPDVRRGAFTSFLLEGLKGDADVDGDGRITGDDLIKHIRDNFQSYALKYKKDQEADAHISLWGDQIHICDVKKNNLNYNYTITFKRNSIVSFFDGTNTLIKNADQINVTDGYVLQIQLPKGLIKIVDVKTKDEKYFTNFNLNTIGNEQF